MIAPAFLAAAGLLVWGGLAKLRRPDPTALALSAAGLRLPGSPVLVRAFGLLEVVVGSLCLFTPRTSLALGLAGMYVLFTGFLVWLIVRQVPVSSCGCLGERDSPPSLLHIVVNLVAASSGLLASMADIPSVLSLARNLPLYGVPFLLGLVTVGYLLSLAEAHLPRLFFSYRRGTAP